MMSLLEKVFRQFAREEADLTLRNQLKASVLADRILSNEGRVALSIRRYINNYFRKYISEITNGFDKEQLKIGIENISSEDKKQMQKIVLTHFEKIEPFITEDNSIIFKHLVFDYSADDINSVYGTEGIALILRYILVTQLNKFLNIAIQPDKDENKGTITKSGVEIARLVADFIITIFDLIEADNDIFTVTKTEYQGYLNQLEYERNKEFEMIALSYTKVDQFLEDIRSSPDEMDEGREQLAEDQFLIEQASEILGSDASQQEIDDYVSGIKNDQVTLEEERLSLAPTINEMDEVAQMEILDYDVGYGGYGENIES